MTMLSPTSLAEPAGTAPLATAVAWLQGAMLGSVATAVAVIAIAAVGLLMLNGRIEWRRGATVVIGCFVLFGAQTIAAGISGLATGDVARSVPPAEPPRPVAARPLAAPSAAYDPYAGASVR